VGTRIGNDVGEVAQSLSDLRLTDQLVFAVSAVQLLDLRRAVGYESRVGSTLTCPYVWISSAGKCTSKKRFA